jgi:hypothetical protein
MTKHEKSEKKKFIEDMNVIKDFIEGIDAASKALQVFAPSSFIVVELGQSLLSRHTVMVSERYFQEKSKTAYEWINWFIYECDMGNKPMEARVNNKPFPVRNFGELYNIIITC